MLSLLTYLLIKLQFLSRFWNVLYTTAILIPICSPVSFTALIKSEPFCYKVNYENIFYLFLFWDKILIPSSFDK